MSSRSPVRLLVHMRVLNMVFGLCRSFRTCTVVSGHTLRQYRRSSGRTRVGLGPHIIVRPVQEVTGGFEPWTSLSAGCEACALPPPDLRGSRLHTSLLRTFFSLGLSLYIKESAQLDHECRNSFRGMRCCIYSIFTLKQLLKSVRNTVLKPYIF